MPLVLGPLQRLDPPVEGAAQQGYGRERLQRRTVRFRPAVARLDLDYVHCKRARALGVKIVINPDAHSTGDLSLFRYGVHVARRGWLTRGDVFNTLDTAAVEEDLGRRKAGAGR